MKKFVESNIKTSRICAFVGILVGVSILLVNQLNDFQVSWMKFSRFHGMIIYGSLFLIFVGIMLWLITTYDSSHGDWKIDPARRRDLISVGLVCLVLGTAISTGKDLNLISGTWEDVTSLIFNAFWLFLTLITLLPSDIMQNNNTDRISMNPPGTSVPQIPQTPSTPISPPNNITVQQERTGKGDRNIKGLPPPFDPQIAQRYSDEAREVYTLLTESSTTAIILTDVSRRNMRAFCSIVYYEIKSHREAGDRLFKGEELWMRIEPGSTITLIDVVGTLLEAALPSNNHNAELSELASTSLTNQAIALLNILNNSNTSRLIVFEGCENWFNRVKESGSGVQEFLDALNSQSCRSKIILMCPPLYYRKSSSRPIYLKEYVVPDMSIAFKQEMPRTHSLFEDIYTNQLTNAQKILLAAFSIYQDEVPLEAAIRQIGRKRFNDDSKKSEKIAAAAMDVLVRENILKFCGEDRYRVETDVAKYVELHFMEQDDERKREQALREAHMKAAQYYQSEATLSGVWSRRGILVKAIWHLCQIQKWEEAYTLALQRNLFFKPENKEDAEILYTLCLSLLPMSKDRWHPDDQKIADIYRYQMLAYDFLEKDT